MPLRAGCPRSWQGLFATGRRVAEKEGAILIADRIAWDDTVLPFQLDRSDIRGRVARLDRSLAAILERHDYPAPVQALVAEAALLTALIGQTVKLRWRLSLQVRGDGPVTLVATDYHAPASDDEPATLRAYARFRDDSPIEGMGLKLLGQGLFGITIDQGRNMSPYQGITPLAGENLSDCAATYFAQSEQLPTHFAIASAQSILPGEAAEWRGGGVMIQHLPKSPPRPGDAEAENRLLAASDLVNGEEEENWNRTVTLLDTVEPDELVGPLVAPDQLLLRLFHEETPRVYESRSVRFGCTCSEEKLRESLRMHPVEELREMADESGQVVATCQFCGAVYSYDPDALGRDDISGI